MNEISNQRPLRPIHTRVYKTELQLLIHNRLREMGQKQLATACQVSQPMISNLLNGHTKTIDLKWIPRFATGLGVTAEHLANVIVKAALEQCPKDALNA